MVATKSDVLNLVNSIPDSDFTKPNSLLNDHIERKQAEDIFFNEMYIAEKSIADEGTISSEKLRNYLGI